LSSFLNQENNDSVSWLFLVSLDQEALPVAATAFDLALAFIEVVNYF
jgi:hypothetical protein